MSDTGPGHSRRARQARLFQPFSRLGVAGRREQARHRSGPVDFEAARRADGRNGARSTARRAVARRSRSAAPPRGSPAGCPSASSISSTSAACASTWPTTMRARGGSCSCRWPPPAWASPESGTATGLPETLRTARAAGTLPDVAIVGHVRSRGRRPRDRESGQSRSASGGRAAGARAGVRRSWTRARRARGGVRRATSRDRSVTPSCSGARGRWCSRSFTGQSIDDPRLITRHTLRPDRRRCRRSRARRRRRPGQSPGHPPADRATGLSRGRR